MIEDSSAAGDTLPKSTGGPSTEAGLTIDQAAALLGERRREPAPADAAITEAAGTEAAVAAPAGWDDEDAAAFRKLPPEAQKRIAARERQRREAGEQSRRALAEQRAAVDRERQAAAAWLAHSLPGMAKGIEEKYAAVDWAKLAQEDAAGYVAKRAEHDADLGRLHAAHREMERAAAGMAAKAQQDHGAFVTRERETLLKLVPDLADEARGPSLKESLRAFAVEAGYTPEQIAWATARDVATLHDAWRWRQAQARRAAADRKPAPAVQTPGVGSEKGEREASAYADGLRRLERSGRIEDALAVMKIKRKG